MQYQPRKRRTARLMRLTTTLLPVLALMTPLLTQADELYQLVWRGTVYSKGANGQVVSRPFSEQNFIRKAAQDNGISNPGSLLFVYRPDKRDTVVVRAATGQFVADVLQMEFQYTDVSNPKQTLTVRQAFLFDEYHNEAVGSAAGREVALRNANGVLTLYSFRGSFQYAFPESNEVYIGSFYTTRRVKDTSSQ